MSENQDKHRGLRVVRNRLDIDRVMAPTPAASAGRPPPMDLDAEQGVLAACLFRPAAFDEVEPILRKDRFFNDANATIWAAMVECRAKGYPIDHINIIGVLNDNDRLRQVGGKSYIGDLICVETVVNNALSYAMRVVEKWLLRALIGTCQRIAAEGYGDVGDIHAFVLAAKKAIDELYEMRATRQEGVLMGAAVDRAEGYIKSKLPGATAVKDSFTIRTGYEAIDRLTGGLRSGEVTLLGAPPKTGKSTFARSIALNVAGAPAFINADGKSARQGVIIVSLEMDEEEIVLCWASTVARVDLRAVETGEASIDELARLSATMDWIRSLPVIIFGRKTILLRNIRPFLREGKQRLLAMGAEPSLAIIDHMTKIARNELKSPERDGRQQDQAVFAEVSAEMEKIAAWSKLPLFVLTQLTTKDNSEPLARGARDIEGDVHAFWLLDVFKKKPATGYPAGKSTTPLMARFTQKIARKGPSGSVEMWFTPAFTLFHEDLWDARKTPETPIPQTAATAGAPA